MKFETTKKVIKEMFSPSSLLLLLWDPGWIKIRIRDKHPGSATLSRKHNPERSVLPVLIDDNVNASGTENQNSNFTQAGSIQRVRSGSKY
jgi:hypothetical protein